MYSASPKKVNILHLSDLHITDDSSANTFRTPLETDLTEELKINPGDLDFLVISGDIGSYAQKEEYDAAYDFVKDLMGYFQLSSNKLIIVPGNHDVNYQNSEKSYSEIVLKSEVSNLATGKYISSNDGGARLRKEELYRMRFNTFNEHFYQKLLETEYTPDYAKQIEWVEHIENKILFVGFNSAWEIDHQFEDRAGICPDALSFAIEKLHRGHYKNWLKIAIWHHPVAGREAMNSDFMEQLVTNGFNLCLHGHIHEAKKENFKYDIRNIHIIGAGTFGAPIDEQMPGIPLQYNLLTYDISKKEFTINTRKKEKIDGAWSGDARWGDDQNNPQSFYKFEINKKGGHVGTNNSHDYCQHALLFDEILSEEEIEGGVEDTSNLYYIPLTLNSHDSKPFKETRDVLHKIKTDPAFNLGKNISVYSTIGSSEFIVVMRATDSIHRKVDGLLKELPLREPIYRGNKVEWIDVATEYRIKKRKKCCAEIPTIALSEDKAGRTFRAFIEIKDIEDTNVYKKLISVISEYENVVVGIGVNKLRDHMMVELFLSCGHFGKLFELTKQLDEQSGRFRKQTFLAYYSDDYNN